MFSNLKSVTVKGNDIQINSDFVENNEGVYYLVISCEGEIIAGNYPNKEKQIDSGKMEYGTHTVRYNNDLYYVKDRYIHQGKENQYFIRGMIKHSDVYSRYEKIQTWSYICIVGMLIMVIVGGLTLSYKIGGSFNQICQTAEEVGKNLDMSKRIEYTGRFREIEVLAQADNRMFERMESTFRSQEQFTADVAHELRTPVAVMVAQCQYLNEQANSMNDYEEALEVISRQSAKMDMLISQLLNLSRMDQGRIQIQKERVDLFEIVQSICEEEQEKANGKVQIVQNLCELYAPVDINLVAIAVNNLIANAVKFSKENGIVTVGMHRRDDKAGGSSGRARLGRLRQGERRRSDSGHLGRTRPQGLGILCRGAAGEELRQLLAHLRRGRRDQDHQR